MNIEQVETAEHRPIVVDEYVKNAGSRLLFGQLGVMAICEVLEVLVAAVGDRRGEVRAIRQFKG